MWDDYYDPRDYNSDYNSDDNDGDRYEAEVREFEKCKRRFELRVMKPIATLDTVKKALKRLINNVSKSPYSCDVAQPQVKQDELFCTVDKLINDDITVTLDGIGKLCFPLEETSIESMLGISKKAKFGSLSETLLDLNVRDTQTIPASKIKVDFDELALAEVIGRMKANLNLDTRPDCVLVPHLHNMLIYGPGQFFNAHRDTEKVKNMIATLVVILPSKFEGGNLIVKHKKKEMNISSSGDFDQVQCIMFYADCEHEVMKIIKGFRVVLTFNVELDPVNMPGGSQVEDIDVDVQVDTAVVQHFSHDRKPKRLVVTLEHRYSEESLKWYLMKGNDRTVANALLAVGKKQKYKTFLALSLNMHLFEETNWDGNFTDGTAELYYWVDENNLKVEHHQQLKKNDVEKEFLCMNGYSSSSEDYKEIEGDGWYGNGPAERKYWYRCACVVLLAL